MFPETAASMAVMQGCVACRQPSIQATGYQQLTLGVVFESTLRGAGAHRQLGHLFPMNHVNREDLREGFKHFPTWFCLISKMQSTVQRLNRCSA